jgi:iron complex outermembrane recepter protein
VNLGGVMKGIYGAVVLGMITTAAHAAENLDSLLNMSFKDLNKVKVTSVSRKEENSFEAAAAVYVITGDDIRRSGATSIAEALRMAPGLDVAQQDSATWAISSRGFNEQFSNKLLVLMDGRTVYTPLFSGVYWDEQDTLLEDIDRIEVIRGPGATLWGANAVNGVINIITKTSKNTQGGYVEAFAGNREVGTGAIRYGGKAKNNLYYRVYAKYKNVDNLETAQNTQVASGLEGKDSWYQSRTGFRADWDATEIDKITFHGDMHESQERQEYYLPGVTGGTNGDEHFRAGNLVGHWDHKFSDISNVTVQAYVDYIQRNISILNQERTTLDLDIQHSWNINPRHEVIWGLGFRYFTDSLDEKTVAGTKYLDYTPDSSDNNLYSGFIQDKIAIVPEKIFLTLGSKVEHNYYTGLELQPNARVSWLPDERQTVWSAVSHAARTPTRGENGLRLTAVPGVLYQEGSVNYESEYLTAYEVGYRIQPNWRMQLDATTFYNDYTDLQTFELDSATVIKAHNNATGASQGIELTGRYSVTRDWNLYASYTFMTLNVRLNDGVSEPVTILEKNETKSAKNKFNIMSRLNFPNHVELDNSLYYVDNLSGVNVPAYLRFDTRIGWRPVDSVELSVVGQNLLDDHHPEFEGPLYSLPTEIGRSIYGKVSYKF